MESTLMSRGRLPRAATFLFVAALAAAASATAQQVFSTPEAAMDALVDGLKRQDDAALHTVLGPKYRRLMPLDAVSEEDRANFLAAWEQGHRVEGDGPARLVLGDGWAMPIPVVRKGEGWTFDVVAAEKQLLIRRIGRNELAAIDAMLAFYDAQRDYAAEDRNGDGYLEYSRHFLSSPGEHDGLYWDTADGEPPSPAGPLFDTTDIEGGYHGYRFKMLEAQGPAARGGKRPYLSQGHLTDGFALVAWPVQYGKTGVMSFLIDYDGVVFQKDLGPASAAIVAAMTRFNPDKGWKPLPPP
jgi:hypothetical protein